jgi:hypothetical protein
VHLEPEPRGTILVLPESGDKGSRILQYLLATFLLPSPQLFSGRLDDLTVLHTSFVIAFRLNRHLLLPGIDPDFLFQILNPDTV